MNNGNFEFSEEERLKLLGKLMKERQTGRPPMSRQKLQIQNEMLDESAMQCRIMELLDQNEKMNKKYNDTSNLEHYVFNPVKTEELLKQSDNYKCNLSETKQKKNISSSYGKELAKTFSEQKTRNRSQSPIMRQSNNQSFTQINNENKHYQSDKKIARYDGVDYHQKSVQQYVQQKNQQHTFKPQIHEMPKDIYKDYNQATMSKEEQWNRLKQNKKDIEIERMQQKIQSQSEEYQKVCTFVPEISYNSKIIAQNIKEQQSQLTLEERLHKEYQEKLQRREQLRRQKQDEESFTFKPEISQVTSRCASQQPLYKRLDNVMKEKSSLIKQLKAQTDKESDITFQPKLNKTSVMISNMIQEDKNVVDRMVKDAAQQQYNKKQLQKQKDQQLSEICTFQPQINPHVDELLENNENYKYYKDFSTRQYLMADQLKEKFQKKMNEILSKEKYEPQINQVSKLMMETNIERAEENQEQKIQRLYQQDHQRQLMTKMQIQERYYDQFTFKPEIDEVSKTIGKAHSIDEMAYNKKGKEQIKQLKENLITEEMNKCTFAPNLNRNEKYKNINTKYQGNIMESIEEQKEQKKKKIQELKKEIEYNTMQNCTFKPNLNQDNKKILKSQSTSAKCLVKGLDKVLEQREMKLKLQKEQKEREEKAFNLEKKYKQGKKKTTVVPFKISQSNNQSAQLLREELEEKMNSSCTFQPQTNEQKRRALIKKYILQSEQ